MLGLILLLPGGAPAGVTGFILDPKPLPLGQPGLVWLTVEPQEVAPTVEFLGRSFPMTRLGGRYLALVSADLEDKTGQHPLVVMSGTRRLAGAGVGVVPKDYGTRRITVKKKFMELSPEDLARHEAERARQMAAYALLTPVAWKPPFILPAPGEVTGAFGKKSLVNGVPKSPHGGVDFRGAMGSPVRAPAGGTVVLVEDTFFSGLVVLIDHGGGVVSGFRHLADAAFAPGTRVDKGAVIGHVGMSGRTTGPHLHYDIHLGGARVDPLAFTGLTRRLAQVERKR